MTQEESEYDLSLLKTKDIAQLIYDCHYLYFDEALNANNPCKVEEVNGVMKFTIGDNVIADYHEVETLVCNAYKTGTIKSTMGEEDEPKVVELIKDYLLYGWLSNEFEKAK